MILSMQHNNETYKHIQLSQHHSRRITSPSRNIRFTKTCVHVLFIDCFLSWLCNLLLLSGDIHPNPGPASIRIDHDDSLSSSASNEILSNHLNIFHLNVQSLLPNIDLIRTESELYDIAVFSESWLKPNITDDKVTLQNFLPPFRTDRCDRPGRGVVIYARDDFLVNDVKILK